MIIITVLLYSFQKFQSPTFLLFLVNSLLSCIWEREISLEIGSGDYCNKLSWVGLSLHIKPQDLDAKALLPKFSYFRITLNHSLASTISIDYVLSHDWKLREQVTHGLQSPTFRSLNLDLTASSVNCCVGRIEFHIWESQALTHHHS